MRKALGALIICIPMSLPFVSVGIKDGLGAALAMLGFVTLFLALIALGIWLLIGGPE